MSSDLKDVQQQIDQGAGFVFLHLEIPASVSLLSSPILFFEKIKTCSPCFYFQKSPDLSQAAETCMGFDPFETIKIINGQVVVETATDRFELKGNPFEAIAERLKKFKVIGRSDLPFFQTGAFGYFGYDSVRFIEPVLNNHKGSFKKIKERDNFIDGQLILFQKCIVIDHIRNKIFLFTGSKIPSSGSLNKTVERMRKSLDSLQEKIVEACNDENHRNIKATKNSKLSHKNEIEPETLKNSLGKERFLAGVQKLKKHIFDGDIFQAVLSERFEFKNDTEPFELFKILIRTQISAYQFYFYDGAKIFFGASPEMLLSVKGNELESHPIAGTRRRGKNAEEEAKLELQLKRSPKERAEHLMLVDLARNDLGRIAKPGSVRVTRQMEIKKFPGVMHLVSVVRGERKEEGNALAALGACFPAGTLSGAPKVRAIQLLSEIENEPRGFYGGAVTLLSFTGDLDSCISIRSIEIDGTRGFIQAGAGIVADSDAEREYEEILHKTKILRQVVATARKERKP